MLPGKDLTASCIDLKSIFVILAALVPSWYFGLKKIMQHSRDTNGDFPLQFSSPLKIVPRELATFQWRWKHLIPAALMHAISRRRISCSIPRPKLVRWGLWTIPCSCGLQHLVSFFGAKAVDAPPINPSRCYIRWTSIHNLWSRKTMLPPLFCQVSVIEHFFWQELKMITFVVRMGCTGQVRSIKSSRLRNPLGIIIRYSQGVAGSLSEWVMYIAWL